MVEAEEIIRAWCFADGDVSNLIGERFYPNSHIPQWEKQRPCIVTERMGGGRIKLLDGIDNTESPTIRLWLVDTDYNRCKRLKRALIGTAENPKLDGFQGEIAGVNVQSVQLQDNDQEDYYLVQDGSDEGEHNIAVDFQVWHDEVTT